ncbi:MAG TPA: alpha-L-fucosidase [Oscillospiraceae bacterium]|nr:alpha-L-fucosidase [Oscillospiraceae bacterium]HPF56061.1 alpha-L-fucosidase [Clostridiales bacterium]HPK36143.1 alpha-L-fucosidase [Oscillospiraceae bacterium]HPR76714.1 alpha-L-fucosidase [Oscillospiraceae bacterium]
MYNSERTKWFRESGYGLFFHFLPGTKEDLIARTEGFDIEGFAGDCAAAGAGHVFVTTGQNSGFLNAPNAAYEAVIGPGYCAKRDIFAELIKAFEPYHIKLMLYHPASAPKREERLGRALGCDKMSSAETTDYILTERFIQNWCAVMSDFSKRYGKDVHGWWIDGCYDWIGFDFEISKRYAAALKSGNPNSIVAFNPGEQRMYANGAGDYCAGEYKNIYDPICTWPTADHIQWHELTFIGTRWSGGDIRCKEAELAAHINNTRAHGGVFTLDVPFEPGTANRMRPDVREFLVRVRKMLK